MGMNKMLEKTRVFQCSKCHGFIEVEADIEQYNYIPVPTKCTASAENCPGRLFNPLPTDSESGMNKCIDYQEIKIQEQPNKLNIGSIPRSITVLLQNDLVDNAKSGDHVTIIGIVIRRWKYLISGERPDIALCISANSVFVHNNQEEFFGTTPEMKTFFNNHWQGHANDPMKARDIIVSSICPQVYGLYIVKLSVLLILIGGVAKHDDSGLKVRGEAHLLLVGDPGTGKSQFLNYAAKISPRSVLTTGIGSTSAGLTVAAVRDGGEWMLEAGALVLADRGICCIDEFSSIRESEKTAVHEAMEQQSVSGAKAGMIINLNARCSVLAATNPKGKYDTEQSITVNVALASPLLSVPSQASANSNNNSKKDNKFTFNQLQQYISWVKNQFHPVSTPESERILTKYYQLQRKTDNRNAARTTIRLLESLIRISQAHARLMARDKVTSQDAIITVMLMESSLLSATPSFNSLNTGPESGSHKNLKNPLHTNFPENPDLAYKIIEKKILEMLDIDETFNR
ncbi:hypothetical protein BB559_003892 [Furculomyces boomerangus]|uniref:DNA helicase n=2 Tax=Harpellales TaxID=61421 RepID=A0A2T9YI11_9FUNG|nr:hypothetical protein BB559_003892 [Furculomyces boomerangus]